MARAEYIAAAIYLVIAVAAGYVYTQTAGGVSLATLDCGDRSYMVDPTGMVLEYKADIAVKEGNQTREATVLYRVFITGNPCESVIPVYTPVIKVEGDDALATLLLNTGLLYPHTLNNPGSVDPAQFLYILPQESLSALRIQAGPNINPGVGADTRIWPSLTYRQDSTAIVGGSTLNSLTKASIDPETGILTELHLASKIPGQEASIDVVLQKIYLPTGAGDHIDQDRLTIAEVIPALIAGFGVALSAYTIASATRE
ncbi:MAG: hypothetical protein F7B18_07945 [Desulfurococcales archaeon]|nr:hypothetical protein [Desulfurococcales archaeon]